MPTQVVCPKCGRSSKSKGDIPAGRRVRCPACGESFEVPPVAVWVANEPATVNLSGIQETAASMGEAAEIGAGDWIDIKSDAKRPRTPPAGWTKLETSKRFGRRGRVVSTVAISILGLGVSFFAGMRTVQPAADTARLDRLTSVFRHAAKSWNYPESEITDLCLNASKYMVNRKKYIDAITVGYLLHSCGRAEQSWRGEEKCQGMDFVVQLFADMIVEGTPEEDAIRMLVKLHAMKAKARIGITAFECDQTRRIVDEQLRMGTFPTRTMAFDKFLRTADLIPGNENLNYK